MSKDTDAAWAAGFWDGEGNVSLTYRQFGPNTPKIPRVVIQVAQVHTEVLEKFQSIIGMGKINGPYKPKTKNSQPYYVWRLEGVPHLNGFRKIIAPYLGSIKLKQIDDAIFARKNWEENARCLVHDTRLEVSSRGTWRCKQCLSDAGKRSAAARWAREEGDANVNENRN